MARKNNRKPRRLAKSKPTERTSWSATDRLQLLAHLDWCVRYCVKFEATAPDFLEKATGKHFSKERIHKKLYKEWQTYGTCDRFKDLLSLGTAGLSPLVGEELDDFHKLFRSMKPPQGARCTRSRSLGHVARSDTLSAPRSTSSLSSRELNGSSIPQASNSNLAQEYLRQRTKTKTAFGPTRLASKNDPSEDELARDHNTDRVKSEDGPELITGSSPERSDMELELNPTVPDAQVDTMTVTLVAQLKADLLKQKSYSVTLENRISDIQNRYHQLDHSIRLARLAHGSYGEEARLRTVNSSLKDKLERDRLLMKNYEELEADRLGFLHTDLRAEYEYLHSHIRDTSTTICRLSLDDTLPEQRTGFSHLANNWARRISGRDLSSLLGHCEAAQIPKNLVLLSLLVAGIFELVFEDVFPAFLAADSPLLDQYRKHIESQSGWNALQRLDVISIKSLLKDNDGILSDNSKRLSGLILQTLSCFLPLESRGITQRPPDNEKEQETISDMEITLHRALKVKTELMMSVKRRKYLFFKPGTLFDAENMEVDRPQAGSSTLESRKVKICISPALFTVPEAGGEHEVRKESSLRTEYTKAVTEVMSEDIESLVLVKKAVVLI